jgi:hypothetical protein
MDRSDRRDGEAHEDADTPPWRDERASARQALNVRHVTMIRPLPAGVHDW